MKKDIVFSLRLSSPLYERIKNTAELQGVSINTLMSDILTSHTGKTPVELPPDILKRISALAEHECRTIEKQIEFIVREHIKENPATPPSKKKHT